MSTKEKIQEIIVANLCVDPELVNPEAKFTDDLGADSLDLAEMTLSVEDHFDIEIADEELWKLETVQHLITLVEAKCALKSA